jgi:hypothetical protein
MTDACLAVALQPALVEEAVLRAIAGRPDERAFRRARDRLYRLPEGDPREHAFSTLHGEWFARLGLGQPIHAALAELPLLAAHCRQCVVTAAPTRTDEGADLLVDDDGARTVLMRLRPTAFLAPDALLALLRAELLHVADMLDRAFGYEPALPEVDSGPTAARLLRDRYRALWNASVAGRLAGRGVADDALVARAQRDFATAFPMLDAAAPAAFARFFTDGAPTHAELVAFAVAPRGAGVVERLMPGGRCPLCRFPTHAPEPTPENLPADLLADITARFPAWRPAHGICRQCADLYRARALSLAAAAQLPG